MKTTLPIVVDRDYLPVVRQALARRLLEVRGVVYTLELISRRDPKPYELLMLPESMRGLGVDEIHEQLNPWRSLVETLEYLVQEMTSASESVTDVNISATGIEVLESMKETGSPVGLRPLTEYIDQWPQARGELMGFASVLMRRSPITGDQVRMAVQLAEMRYRQLVQEVSGGSSTIELLRAAHTYISHYVASGHAEVDGFDSDAWCNEVEKILPLEVPDGQKPKESRGPAGTQEEIASD